jgi:hypothetical protein
MAITLTRQNRKGNVCFVGQQSPLHHHHQCCSFMALRLAPPPLCRGPVVLLDTCTSSSTSHSRVQHPLKPHHLYPHRHSVNLSS